MDVISFYYSSETVTEMEDDEGGLKLYLWIGFLCELLK